MLKRCTSLSLTNYWFPRWVSPGTTDKLSFRYPREIPSCLGEVATARPQESDDQTGENSSKSECQQRERRDVLESEEIH